MPVGSDVSLERFHQVQRQFIRELIDFPDFLLKGRFSDGYERHGLWEEGFCLVSAACKNSRICEYILVSIVCASDFWWIIVSVVQGGVSKVHCRP